MKYYTTFITSLILSAVLLVNNTVSAASLTPSWSVGYPNASAIFISSYTVEYDIDSTENQYPHGNYCVATYEINMPINITPGTTDSYVSGYASAGITFAPTTPTGYTYRASEISFESYNIDNVSSFISAGSNSSASTYSLVRCIFDNYFSHGITIGIGQLTAKFTYTYPVTPNNVPDPVSRISCSTTISSSTTQLSASVNPTAQAFVAEIIAALNNAYIGQNTTEINDHVYTILEILQNMQQKDSESYEDIIDALASNNEWNAILSSWLNSISTDTLTISQNTTEILSFLSTYIPKLRTIDENVLNIYNKFTEFFTYYKQQIDKGNTAASSAAQAVENVESKAEVINDVQKPNVDNFVQDVDLHITPEVTGGMNIFKAFINRPYFVLILTAVFALAFVSYLLYGKGV